MNALPEPTCGDCIAFSGEGRTVDGAVVGSCRFRPELGQIPEHLRYCAQFSVRKTRAGQVRIPEKPKQRGVRRTASARPGIERATLKRPVTGDTSGDIEMDRDGLKQVLRELLEEETLYGYCEIAPKWDGGTLVLKPVDASLQAKEMPLETFFHKIVMIRDRLRVLEAKLNASNLDGPEKLDLQQYVTKIYGTLTTFNVLFRDKADHFSSK
ncbi:MAG: hypothetical protein H6707_14450 [Deltaproteobacteria bacterium]|nr:hypothetical protein [Deltaproteobacteria bacterium]